MQLQSIHGETSTERIVRQIKQRRDSEGQKEEFNKIFGGPGHRKHLPLSLRNSVRKRLDLGNTGNIKSANKATEQMKPWESQVLQRLSEGEVEITLALAPESLGLSPAFVRELNQILPGKMAYVYQTDSVVTIAPFTDRYTLATSTGERLLLPVTSPITLRLKEPVIQKAVTGQEIKFEKGASLTEREVNFSKLFDGQMYEVRQPFTGANFSALLEKPLSSPDATDAVRLFFTDGNVVSSMRGTIVVRAVSG